VTKILTIERPDRRWVRHQTCSRCVWDCNPEGALNLGMAGKKSPHFAEPEIKAFGSKDGGHAIAANAAPREPCFHA
jgi:hypothetical protein